MSQLNRVLEPEVMDTPDEAADYDAMDHREVNEAFVRRLAALGARGRMIDLGVGPGHIPLLVCDAITDAIIVGVDLSAEMLKIAEHRRGQSPHRDRIAYELADVKALPFADGSFDAVISNTILHHIPHPGAFLREAWRVLRPGGVLLIRDLFRPATRSQLDALVATHAGDCNDHQRNMFAASLHAALTPEELRDLAAQVGMTGVEVVVDTDRHMSLQTMRTR